ncbi:hypothetical protein B1748_27925 [Paenibacillus sp. MY03]|nr:hypothetical protein B1748_27925 [Paenibacillus sp. MY03]
MRLLLVIICIKFRGGARVQSLSLRRAYVCDSDNGTQSPYFGECRGNGRADGTQRLYWLMIKGMERDWGGIRTLSSVKVLETVDLAKITSLSSAHLISLLNKPALFKFYRHRACLAKLKVAHLQEAHRISYRTIEGKAPFNPRKSAYRLRLEGKPPCIRGDSTQKQRFGQN